MENRMNFAAVVALSLIVGAGCVSQAKVSSLETTPDVVRTALTKAAGSNKIEKVEQETENGKTIYEASFDVNDVDHTVSVDETGKVLEEESEVKVADLPAAVSAAVLKAQPLARVKEASLVTKDGKSYYEVDAKVGKDKHELSIASDGKLIADKVEDEDHDGDNDHGGAESQHGQKHDAEDKD